MKWTKAHDYGKRGPIFYECIHRVDFSKYQAVTMLAVSETRVNGPNTACARVHFYHHLYGKDNLYKVSSLMRHFTGSHAGQSARRWCESIMKEPPTSVMVYSQTVDKLPKKLTGD
jgi:hypothetical protein